MQGGSLISNDVLSLNARITVAGVDRLHESWHISRDLVGDLPDQVAAVSGIRQATGSIVWAEQPDVTDMSANPWNTSTGWVPKTGEQVIIRVGDGITTWNQFVGVIDETTGGAGESMESSIVDYIDYLNREINHTTVFRNHPPKSEGGDYLAVGMGPPYAVDRAMRSCGFNATPRLESGSLLSVPAQISVWPERGSIIKSVTHPVNHHTTWGWCVSDINTSYTPNSSATRSTPVQLTATIAADHAGTFTLDAVYGSDFIRLMVTPARGVIGRLNGTNVASLASMGADTVVTLLVKSGVWTIKTASATATGSLAVPAGSDLTVINAVADSSSRVAGLQVSKPTLATEFASINHTPGFNQSSLNLSGRMSVLRSVTPRPAIDYLTEISKATLSPFWFAENGGAKMISSDLLTSSPSVQTVTTLNDITKLSWASNRLGVRSKVIVQYQDLALRQSKYSNVTLWQGSGETLESGQDAAYFATEPADEDWAEIDTGAVASAGGITAFNQGRGSWVNAYLEDSSGGWSDGSAYVTWDPITQITNETRLFHAVAKTLPAGRTLVLGIPDDPGYLLRFRGMGMPILRGRGKSVWTDQRAISAIAGPSGFPELTHDAGPWLTESWTDRFPMIVADYIAGQVSVDRPTITGMEVIYDPRRQLGDVITISSPTYMGVELTALIVGVRNSAGDDFKQSLTVRVITAKSTFTTYAAHEAAYSDSLTYEQWRLLYPDTTTYAGFNADPLRGAL